MKHGNEFYHVSENVLFIVFGLAAVAAFITGHQYIGIGIVALVYFNRKHMDEAVSFVIGVPLIFAGAIFSIVLPLLILMYIGGWRPW
jgi:hypothetical protein